MKVGDLENIIKEIMPFHENVFEPIYKGLSVPFEDFLNGFNLYPSWSRRMYVMGRFYETLNRGLYGGKLNDLKFDTQPYKNGGKENEDQNTHNRSSSIKPDVVDEKNKINWESKATYFDGECLIVKRQLDGYKFLQYSNPEKTYFISIYRHTLPEIKKQNRTEENVVNELNKRTAFSIVLPLSVILKMSEMPFAKGVRLARNYKSKNQNWPDTLCISPHTINRFLINPLENFDLLGFDSERFEIERYTSPLDIKINRKKVKQFPIVKISDRRYKEWIEEFSASYESEFENQSDDLGTEDLPIYEELEETEDTPF